MEALAHEQHSDGQEEAYFAQMFDCVLLAARITLGQCEKNKARSHGEFPGASYRCRTCKQKPVTKAEKIVLPPADKPAPIVAVDQQRREWLETVERRRKGERITQPVRQKPAQNIPENIPEEKTMANQRGTCGTCKRPDVLLPYQSGTQCGRCDYRIKNGRDPITNEPIDKGVKPTVPGKAIEPTYSESDIRKGAIADLILLGYKGAIARETVANLAIPSGATVAEVVDLAAAEIGKAAAENPAPPPAASVPEPAPATSFEVAKQEEGPQDLCPLSFTGDRDAELLRLLKESAAFNRRSLADEILFRLDRSLDLHTAVLALKGM